MSGAIFWAAAQVTDRPNILDDRRGTIPRNVAAMSADHRSPTRDVVEAAFRQHRAQVLAALVKRLRDFELADDVLQEAFALALRALGDGRAAAVARGVAVHRRAQPGDRPPAQPARDGAGARSAGCRRGACIRGARSAPRHPDRDRGRAPQPAVHVLPPRARARGAGRADPPGGGRSHRGGDRAGVPGAGRHDGTAPGPRQAQDPRRRHLVRAARRRRRWPTASTRCSRSST